MDIQHFIKQCYTFRYKMGYYIRYFLLFECVVMLPISWIFYYFDPSLFNQCILVMSFVSIVIDLICIATIEIEKRWIYSLETGYTDLVYQFVYFLRRFMVDKAVAFVLTFLFLWISTEGSKVFFSQRNE